MDIFVTGIGLHCAIGKNSIECYHALANGSGGIRLTSFDDKENPLHLGSVLESDSELKKALGIENTCIVPRTALLGMSAVQECIKDKKRSGNGAFINGTTTGGMDLTEQYFKSLYEENNHTKVQYVSSHDLGTVTELIVNHLGISGYVNTISTACSSSANSIMLAARMMRAGLIDWAIAGGCDALCSFTINGFSSLMIYDQDICRPFDQNRNGLNLGEGAAYLMLESEKSRKRTGNKTLAILKGWNNANDSFHETASSPDGKGACAAMSGALLEAGIHTDDIDYLNAHGTATRNNDDSEMKAIESLFQSVEFSSTKGFTGHTLGASGAVESVVSVLSLLHQCVFPNLNWEQQMHGRSMLPVRSFEHRKVSNVMSNSFGFGGNSSTLIFSKS